MVQPAPPSSRVVLSVAHLTDPGLDPDKQVNEDACAAGDLGLGHLLVVCDGMGGHMGGKEASEAALRTIFADIEAAPVGTNPGAALKAAIEHAGRVVFELGGAGANMLRPGSTVVAILSHAAGSEVAHVGDSRGYLMRGGQIFPLTRDHSMVQQMVDAGVLKAEEAVGHPDANKITRALGMSAAVEVELRPTPLAHQKGDIFLLASDGLCDLVSPPELLSATSQARQARSLEFASQQLVSMANARGGHDNITVLLAEITDCPTCTETKTFIPVDTPVPIAGPPATMPVLPALGSFPATDPAAPPAVHPTMVDDSVAPVVSGPIGESGSPPPTWVGDDPHGERESESDLDAVKRRRVLWLVVGAVLILFGLLLVISSIWWAYSATAASQSGRDERLARTTAYTLATDALASFERRPGQGQRFVP